MRPSQGLVLFLVVLSRTQAQNDATPDANNGVQTTNPSVDLTTTSSTGTNNDPGPVSIDARLSTDSTTSGGQTNDQPDLIMVTPDGPGIHAGFQATGPNFATSLSGGVKSSDGATLETGFNFAGRIGESGVITQSSGQQPGNTQQQQSGINTRDRLTQGASSPLDGATFAVSYKPGLLSAIGNMLNPMRMLQRFGDTLAGFTGFGQGNPMTQAQPQQYYPPQTSRSMSSNTGNNGVGITWKPLYRVFW